MTLRLPFQIRVQKVTDAGPWISACAVPPAIGELNFSEPSREDTLFSIDSKDRDAPQTPTAISLRSSSAVSAGMS
jgi:hypothetical protein